MPKSLPAKCRDCGAKRADGAAISRTGLCPDCAIQRVVDNQLDLAEVKERNRLRREATRAAALAGEPPPTRTPLGGRGSQEWRTAPAGSRRAAELAARRAPRAS